MKLKFLLTIVFSSLFTGVFSQTYKNQFSFNKPAASLQAAFPISNGAILALTSGTLALDRIPVYDGLLWSGAGATSDNMPFGMPFRKMADLVITHTGHNTATSYSRDLNLNTGISTVRYTIKGVTYTRTYVSSTSDSVLLINIKASKPASISIKFNVTSTLPQKILSRMDDRVVLTGLLPAVDKKNKNVKYRLEAKPYVKNGRILYTKDLVNITKADEVTIIVSTSCNLISDIFNDEENMDPATRYLNRAFGKEFSQLQQNHVSTYIKELQSIHWTFETTGTQSKTTDMLLQDYAAGKSPEFLLSLAAYGRYLRRYCSTNKVLYPNEHYDGASGMEPNVLSVNGLVPIWPSELFVSSGQNNSGADAWMHLYIWKTYRYSDQLDFLQSQYTFLKSQTSKWMLPAWSGSSSPNEYKLNKSMVNGMYSMTLAAANVLNGGLKSVLNRAEKNYTDSIKRAQTALSYADKAAGDATSILGLDDLIPVYPLGSATPYNGFKQISYLYTALAGTGTNVPGEWIAGTWLRLFNSNKAMEVLRSKKIYPNLLDATGTEKSRFFMSLYPLVLEMLLQSHDDFVFVLPALPAFWKNGSASGLSAEGGFTFNLNWKNGTLVTVHVESKNNKTCRIRSRVPLTGKNLKPVKEEILSAEAANMLPVTYLYEMKMNAGEKVDLKI